MLRESWRVIQEALRTVDAVGRYGGEEFLAILPHTPHEEAMQTAERVRSQVAGHVFKAPGNAARADHQRRGGHLAVGSGGHGASADPRGGQGALSGQERGPRPDGVTRREGSMTAINSGSVWRGAIAGGVAWTVWSTVIGMLIAAPLYVKAQQDGVFLAQPRYPFFIGAWIVLPVRAQLRLRVALRARAGQRGRRSGDRGLRGGLGGVRAGFSGSFRRARGSTPTGCCRWGGCSTSGAARSSPPSSRGGFTGEVPTA